MAKSKGKQSVAKKAPTKKSAVKKAKSSVKSPTKKAAPKIVATKKAAPKKAAAKKAPAMKAASQKATPATKAPAIKANTAVVKKSSMKISDWEKFLTPLDDRLIVQVEEGEKMTPGGLYIPDTVDATGNFKGTVMAVGRGHRNKKGQTRPMDVKAGDVVLFSEHSGMKMALEGQNVKILRESEILGIVLKN